MTYFDMPVNEYIEALSSKSPVPGGGGTSALVAALGCALGNMVGSLTVGKKKYADIEDELWKLKGKAKAISDKLLMLVDKDPEVFAKLAEAYKLPKETEEEKAHKDEVMEKRLREACKVPLDIMEECAKAIDVIGKFAAKGSPLAISDAGVGAILCKAAMQGAALNVYINTKSMKHVEYANELNSKCMEYLGEYCPKADKIYSEVESRVHVK